MGNVDGKPVHEAAFSWVQYIATDGSGDTLRIFNAVDEPMALVMKIKGREYRQQTFTYVQELKPDLKPGDWVQRYLPAVHAHKLAQQEAEARHRTIRKDIRPPLSVLKDQLVPKWKKKTVVVSLDSLQVK